MIYFVDIFLIIISDSLYIYGVSNACYWYLITDRAISKCANCETVCQSCTTSVRGITTSQSGKQQTQALENVKKFKFSNPTIANKVTEDIAEITMAPMTTIVKVEVGTKKIDTVLSNGQKNSYPTAWLRDNCQCHDCFDPQSLGRAFLMDSLDLNISVKSASTLPTGDVEIIWEDGHKSVYNSEWLQQRAFSEEARGKYRKLHLLPKVGSYNCGTAVL